MAVVDASSVDVPLSLFCGWVTELSPSAVPEGISPDNQDVVFIRGAETRPAIQRVFATPIEGLGTIVYEKSFVPPSGDTKNLYLTSDGVLWVEDVTASPGVATKLFTSGATSASSVTAFGREYIALSDGVHGADVPIQYDGTNLWRVTQDGPGAPPTVNSVALPTVAAALGSPVPVNIQNIATTDAVIDYGPPRTVLYYASILINLLSAGTIVVGQTITITGSPNSYFNTTWTVSYVFSPTEFKCSAYAPTRQTAGTGGSLTSTGFSLSRGNNIVTANTAAAHGLKVGYQALMAGYAASLVGNSINSIVLKNADSPGIATVTTALPHGLLPNNNVSITGVNATTVGTSIASVVREAQVSTLTTATAHNLQIGAVVNVATSVAGNKSFNGQWMVTAIPSTTTFTYSQVDADFASASDAGSVTYVWPLASANPQQNYFTVLTAPSATTFTIALSYTDGTWTGGTITFGWDGTFYVTAVLSPTSFQYQQYGPNNSTTSIGSVTPNGQATPGIHQCQVLGLLASGAITAPSPPTTFIANGGQYLSVTGIATGPSNWVGRILQFTGAGGAYFFYIPQPAQVNGQTVSTATQINDNTTTSVILDFADATLYASLATSIPGNNLAAQVVLGPCAGFFTYANRLQAWGEYNKIQKLVNMGFDGGSIMANVPAGWTASNAGGSLIAGRIGSVWSIAVVAGSGQCGNLSQNAAISAFDGSNVLTPNTTYTLRAWISSTSNSAGLNFVATLASASTGFTSTATINGASMTTAGSFLQANFGTILPAVIPSDLLLTIYATSVIVNATIQVDEIELIFTAEPYLDTQERISYAGNPEGFDGLTGVFGAQDDPSPIRNHGVIRNSLYLVTGNQLHETNDNGSTEPSGWGVTHVADNCGAWSIAAVARNPQGSGSAGKEWMTWSGPDGAQLFTGETPEKVSQEIQSAWDAIDSTLVSQCWTKNDQTMKRCYYGVPLSSTQMQVLVLDYRNLDGQGIANSPPVRVSYTGKMIATDNTRKWTRWTISAYSGEMMMRPGNAQPVMTFGCGFTGAGPNVYTLNPNKHTDDDLGIIPAYYTTYFFVSHEMEQGLQLGGHRKEYDYLTAFVPGIGTVTFTPLLCSLTNAQAATPPIAMSTDPAFDLEIGINVITSRCAFKVSAQPFFGQTDTYFSLQKLIVNMKKSPFSSVRGSNTGSY